MLDKLTVPAALQNSLAEGSTNSLEPDEGAIERRKTAVAYAGLLNGGFRKMRADDPEIFVRSLESVLAEYDPDIQKEVCRPGRWKYQPETWEIREACEAIIKARWRSAEREEAIRRQLDERRRLDALEAQRKLLAPPRPSADAARHPTVAEIERLEAQRVLDKYASSAADTHGVTMSVPARSDPSEVHAIAEQVLVKGDLAELTPEERNRYYFAVCNSLGLNPLTKPFEFLLLNGRLTLYALRSATDQLRTLRSISIEIVDRRITEGVALVHVRARDQAGRTDEDVGAVPFPEKLQGEARANALMKAITKAKRRVTLSIAGLGMLDESEIEDLPANVKQQSPGANAPKSGADAPHDPETGEVFDHEQYEAELSKFDKLLAAAAGRGTKALQEAWMAIPGGRGLQQGLKGALDRRHKPRAEQADAGQDPDDDGIPF